MVVNKKIMFFVTVTAIFAVSLVFISFNRKMDIPISSSQKISNDVINRLCTAPDEDGNIPFRVSKCSEFYSVSSGRNIADKPNIRVDASGKPVALCGGMPYPGMREDDQCKTPCDTQNLCDRIVIDCSSLTSLKKDSCLFENFMRTGDYLYCTEIVNDYFKERCMPAKPIED